MPLDVSRSDDNTLHKVGFHFSTFFNLETPSPPPTVSEVCIETTIAVHQLKIDKAIRITGAL